jgi:hypothetical protein
MSEEKEIRNVKFTWKMFLISFSFLIVLSPFFLYQLYRNKERRAIRKNQALTTARITALTYQRNKAKSWYRTLATYQVGNARFTCTGSASYTLSHPQRSTLIGAQLPVIYEKDNPANGELLVSERQFDRFNLSFPDSLAWTKAYFLE